MDTLIRLGVIAGIILGALVVIGLVLTRLYRRATKDVSLIRTGFGGERVVINGGILVIPVLHELTTVKMTTLKLEVNRTAKDALITLDKIRVDVTALFHIKVRPNALSIAAAAQTLGSSVNNPDSVRQLFEGKLISALRSVAATMSFEHLHSSRADFIQKVQEAVQSDLDMNGFQLESVNVTHFDQTNFAHLDENNVFDADGMTAIAKTVEDRKRERNEIQATNRVAIERRNLEANMQSLDIAQESEQASLTQAQSLAASRATQQAAISLSESEAEQARETARITTEKVVKTAEIDRDGAVQTATITRDRSIELSRIDTAVQTQQKSEEESKARGAAATARAEAIRAEESITTAKVTEIANREKNVAVIGAERDAQQKAVGVTVQAQAEADAAELRAKAVLTAATAEAEAKKVGADADERVNEVRASGERSYNEATNVTSDAQTALLARRAMLEAMPAIIAAAAKPMENIDRISIIDARGLQAGNGAGGDDAAQTGSLADSAVSAALRYRVGAPMIDRLLGEIGMGGGSMDALMGAVVPAPKPSDAPGKPEPVVGTVGVEAPTDVLDEA